MTINLKTDFTAQDVASLYYLIGEAVCMIQHLEGALSGSVTLKKDVKYPGMISKEEAQEYLDRYHDRFTLGKIIKEAKKNSLYTEDLYNDLDVLLEERNWLIHKFLYKNLEEVYVESTREKLFYRIKAISNQAIILKEAIEVDLIEFSESVCMDMSKIRAYMKQYSDQV